jgi:hypothetical protein
VLAAGRGGGYCYDVSQLNHTLLHCCADDVGYVLPSIVAIAHAESGSILTFQLREQTADSSHYVGFGVLKTVTVKRGFWV